MTTAQRLHDAISVVAPIDGVSIGVEGVVASCRIDFTAAATPEQRVAGQAVLDAFDWSPAAAATYEARQAKALASKFYDVAQTAAADVSDRVIIAFAQLVLDRFNLTSQRFTDLQAAIQASTSLADFKTRAATVGTLPQITQKQLVDAIKAKIASTAE